ncbi:hypothetical protein PAUR_a1985 [Pseudoalteromonas aurantia 208]|uniref:Uncharacterized protein n=1 Tax=Pseudoalteromonas aurantia 208 TaxID=1314867 RepID=A0ABR9EBL2_9GAMM|nr:hypothetical protein [Pseudoalteromonas aurantia 208]
MNSEVKRGSLSYLWAKQNEYPRYSYLIARMMKVMNQPIYLKTTFY